jgi:hypothetical protein
MQAVLEPRNKEVTMRAGMSRLFGPHFGPIPYKIGSKMHPRYRNLETKIDTVTDVTNTMRTVSKYAAHLIDVTVWHTSWLLGDFGDMDPACLCSKAARPCTFCKRTLAATIYCV